MFATRFNNAPTGGEHMKDVGRKTSIRVVNSQVVAKPQFKFLESKEIHKQDVFLLISLPRTSILGTKRELYACTHFLIRVVLVFSPS